MEFLNQFILGDCEKVLEELLVEFNSGNYDIDNFLP